MLKNKLEFSKVYVLLCFIIFCILYTFQSLFHLQANDMIIHILMALFLILSGLYTYKKYKEDKNNERIIMLMIIWGIIVRVGFSLYNIAPNRSHDMWGFVPNSGGHDGYILNIMINKQLPMNNTLQNYQQPFYYLLSSAFSFVLNIPFGFDNYERLVDSAKSVSLLASMISLVYSKRIIYLLTDKFTSRFIALSLICFVPACWYLAGTIGPDALAQMFLVIALYYTITLYDDFNWINIIRLALIYGFGMMTKISCATAALVTLFVFVIIILKKFNIKNVVKILLFGIISFPIGLWFSVRNYLMFNQSLTYVLELEKDFSGYTGNKSLIDRFVLFNIKAIIDSPFVDYDDVNILTVLIKTALFDENYMRYYEVISYIMIFTSIVIFVLMLIGYVYYIVKIVKNTITTFNINRLVINSFFIVMVISIISFYNKYPFYSSCNFRYYVTILIPLGFYLGELLSDIKLKMLKKLFIGIVLLICSSSIMLSLMMYTYKLEVDLSEYQINTPDDIVDYDFSSK